MRRRRGGIGTAVDGRTKDGKRDRKKKDNKELREFARPENSPKEPCTDDVPDLSALDADIAESMRLAIKLAVVSPTCPS